MNTFFLRFTLIMLASGHAIAAEPDILNVQIGNSFILIPAPQGFVNPAKEYPELNKLIQPAIHPEKRILAGFIAKPDPRTVAAGGPPSLDQFFTVESLKLSETTTVSLQSFEQVKLQMKTNYQKLVRLSKTMIDEIARNAMREAVTEDGKKISLLSGEPEPIGTFGDSAHSIGVTILNTYTTVAGDTSQTEMLVTSIMTTLIKGRYVYLQACSTFKTGADIHWTQQAAIEWLHQIDFHNQQ